MTTVSEKRSHQGLRVHQTVGGFAPAIIIGVLIVLILLGIALVILSMTGSSSIPAAVSFHKVFKETSNDPFESKILKEVDQNLVLQAYYRSLVPSEPAPPSFPFFAYSKPLGD